MCEITVLQLFSIISFWNFGISIKVVCWARREIWVSTLHFEMKNLFQKFFSPLKLRHYEKATVVSKQVGDFFKFLWPSQKSWTLTIQINWSISHRMSEQIWKQNTLLFSGLHLIKVWKNFVYPEIGVGIVLLSNT